MGEATAEDQYAILADAAEQQRENDEAGDYTQYVSDVAGDYQAWINTVTNGIAAQYAAYFGGAADATAVANAWKQYDQNVASDWDNLVVGEANDFQIYVQQEEAALDSAEDDIAAHNETREDNIATDLLNEVNTVAPAIDTFEHSVDGLMTPWMTTAAGAERTEGDDDAGSENTFELFLAPQTQSLYDNEASDADSGLHTAESDESSEFTNVVNDEDAAALLEDTQFDIELTTIRQKHTTLETDDLASWDTKELADLPADDALMVAYAADMQAQSDLSAVNNFDNIAAQPLPSFDSQLWQQASLMPSAMTFVTTDDDYLNWGSAIAGVGPIAPTSFLQEVQESVQPSNQSFFPMTTLNPLMPIPGPPQDFVNSLLQTYLGLFDGGIDWITTTNTDTVLPNAWFVSHPNQPSLTDTMIPFYGGELPWQYQFDSGNFLNDPLNWDMMATDTFIVRPDRAPFDGGVLLAFVSNSSGNGPIFAPFTPPDDIFNQPPPPLVPPFTPPPLNPTPHAPLGEENDIFWPQLEPDDWRDLPERWNLDPKPWYQDIYDEIKGLKIRPKMHFKFPHPGHPGYEFGIGGTWQYG